MNSLQLSQLNMCISGHICLCSTKPENQCVTNIDLFCDKIYRTEQKIENIPYSRHMYGFFKICFGVFRSTRDVFTHMEMSPLSTKGCKFKHMLGTHKRRN